MAVKAIVLVRVSIAVMLRHDQGKKGVISSTLPGHGPSLREGIRAEARAGQEPGGRK